MRGCGNFSKNQKFPFPMTIPISIPVTQFSFTVPIPMGFPVSTGPTGTVGLPIMCSPLNHIFCIRLSLLNTIMFIKFNRESKIR